MHVCMCISKVVKALVVKIHLVNNNYPSLSAYSLKPKDKTNKLAANHSLLHQEQHTFVRTICAKSHHTYNFALFSYI